jgi:hypothetical protein
VVTIMLLYCAMTPLGVFVGMAELLVRGTTGRAVESFTQAFGAGEYSPGCTEHGKDSIVSRTLESCNCLLHCGGTGCEAFAKAFEACGHSGFQGFS